VSLLLYFDHNVRVEIAEGLRRRGVDVVTAREDGRAGEADDVLLDRATTLDRALVTHDRHFLGEAARCRAAGVAFPGVIYGSQSSMTIGQFVEQLELIARVYDPPDIANMVQFLPL
jgi:hypothetical protein